MRFRVYVSLVLLAAATPVFADLAVTSNLGTATTGVYALNGTTVGKTNNADTYSSIGNTSRVSYGYGEAIYQFTLTKPAYLYLTDTSEPDADGVFPDPDHDYFLLNALGTFTTTKTNQILVGKREATSLSFVPGSFNDTTSGSDQLTGVFASTGNTNGLRPAGTYYVAVDSRNASINAAGTATSNFPDGGFGANLHVTYADEVVAPTSTLAAVQSGGQIRGSYSPGDVKFFSFNYAGGDFTVNTQTNTLNEGFFDPADGGDTFLALYNSAGALVKFNDDVDFRGFSQIVVANGELANGTYYLGFTEYKGEAKPGFNLRVYPSAVGASGEFVINGLALAPEPASLAAAAAGLAVAGIRRRRVVR